MNDNESARADTLRIIADAIEEARDGLLDPQQLESIRLLLLTNQEARRFYLEYNRLSHLLASAEFKPADTSPHVSSLRASVARGRWADYRFLALAAAACLLLIALALNLSGPRDLPARVIASLEQVDGSVTVTSVDAEFRAAQPGIELLSGDTIRTGGSLSSAVLAYPDGTRVLILESTAVTFADERQKSVVVHSGTLSASVAEQPDHAPMLLATPQDRVEVLGTKFVLQAKADETDVSVNEGRVRLTRHSDGRSLEVPAGRRVVSSAESELVLQDIPATPVDWSLDFESGLPADWQTGEFVTDDLPGDSRGGVRADRLRQGGHDFFNILTGTHWAFGLFAMHEDSHLNFTFKMEQPSWIDIIICTRAIDGDPPPFSSNYIFNDHGWWPDEPGQWATVSIPLSAFRRAAGDRVPIEQVVPFSLLFSSPDGDRGLVIDRMWVTRGGPGVVQTRDAE